MSLEPKLYEEDHWCPYYRFSGASARNTMAAVKNSKASSLEFMKEMENHQQTLVEPYST